MTNGWIIDVLTDLRAFASANDLPALETELGEAVRVAKAELATGSQVIAFVGSGEHDRSRNLSGAPRSLKDAG